MPVESIAGATEAITAEWQMPEVGGVEQAQPTRPAQGEGEGFGSLLADQVGNLQELQTDAARQAQALATGQAEDVASVVMSVERAQLSMQLASQLRNKAVEAYQEIFRTQV